MSNVLTNAAEYTVSELSQAVRRSIEDEFGYVRVRGEISGFRGRHSSGHAYFTLKDENAALDAVVWKLTWPRLTFKPEEGLEIIATGRLTTYPRSSKYQLVIDQIEPAGAGALMALLEERRKKLAAEGLFAAERKRPLPYLPKVIGVVTSPTGAVIRDILHRLSDRFPVHVLVWPVRVQGETTAVEVSAAVAGFNRLVPNGHIPRPDLLIVARGGGSIEDLWGFNEELVVRAVAASQIPVIAAVGHETDTTLVDYAADYRAPTPTAAAEAAVPVRAELIGYVDDIGGRTRHAMRRIGGSARDRLRAASAGLPRPSDIVGDARQRLDKAAERLAAALRHTGQVKQIELARCAAKLTPSMLSRRAEALEQRVAALEGRLTTGVSRGLERRRGAFVALAGRLSTRTLAADLRHNRARFEPVATRLLSCFRTRVTAGAQRLAELDRLLESYSYERVLERGFAVVTDSKGTIIRQSEQVRPGQSLNVRVARDDFGVSVTGAPIWPRKRKRSVPDDNGQQSLF